MLVNIEVILVYVTSFNHLMTSMMKGVSSLGLFGNIGNKKLTYFVGR